ncbi:MAG TPA: molybdopterin cofactor-binding domain-containing protein, partial [Gemmatimonadales bacterium]|nr:molybdopterin cofactor-binding domain-containing protein [Gemmatimonadales bacterium]
MAIVTKLARRDFLRLGAVAGGGLLLGVRLRDARADEGQAGGDRTDDALQPGAFVRVGTDDRVTIWLARSDMGQGVRTALPMIVADELDAAWEQVTVVQADAHPTRYGRMMTVGSTSVRGGAWMPLRQAGATARAMLVAAAANRWGVAPESCRTANGRVTHAASGRSARYGELAAAATLLPVPGN